MFKWFEELIKFFESAFDKVFSGGSKRSDPAPPAAKSYPPAVGFVRAAMITPIVVNKDRDAVRAQARQIAGSRDFNSVATLVDLQSGRDYIFPGRTATALAPQTRENIGIILSEGVTPVLIIRNDWAARTGRGVIPSAGGKISNEDFYTGRRLETERQFLSSLKDLYPHVHLQLNIEPSLRKSAGFALELARHLRREGFKNQIFVNPAYDAIMGHQDIRNELNAENVIWARSQGSGVETPDQVFNSDGNDWLNAGRFPGFMDQVNSKKKPYIIWSSELAGVSQKIPDGYIRAGEVPVGGKIPEPEYINYGGPGLYKPYPNDPDWSLYIMPDKNPRNGFQLEPHHIGKAGVYGDEAGRQHKKWLDWPGVPGWEHARKPVDGTRIPDAGTNYAKNDRSWFFRTTISGVPCRIKFRGALVVNDGDWIIIHDIFGQELWKKQIKQKLVRQE